MFSSGAFFAFLGGGSLLADRVYELSPSQYGFYFMFISLGYLLGNMISGRITKRIGINKMMLSGNITVGLGLAASIIFIVSGVTHPFAFFGFIFFVGLGGSLQLGGGAILSVIAGYTISAENGAAPLAIMMLISIICGSLGTLYVMHVERQLAESGSQTL